MSESVSPQKTVVALFDELHDAREALNDLVKNSFDRDDVSLIAHGSAQENSQYFNANGQYVETTNEGGPVEESIHRGVNLGALLGGLAGLLLGMVLLPVPGVGLVIIAGPLASAAAWAGVGALAGGMVGELSQSGVSDEHAAYYAEGIRRGGSLIVVKAAPEKVHLAVTVVNEHHPVDIEKRAHGWKEAGWTGFDPEAKAYTLSEIDQERTRVASE